MAVTLDSTGFHNFVTGGTNTAVSVTVSASCTSMLAWMAFSADPGGLVVSWNSSTQFLTQLTTSVSTGPTVVGSMWGLLGPAAGTFLLRGTWGNTVNAQIGGVTFFNTSTDTIANCFKNLTTNTSASQLPSITVTSQSSDMVVGVFASTGTIDSVDNTQIYILNSGSLHSAANEAAGAASVALGSSLAGSAVWVSMGVDVTQAPTASSTAAVSFQAPAWSALPSRNILIGT